jgi:hypothetical protein
MGMNLYSRRCCYCKEDVIDISKKETWSIVEYTGIFKILYTLLRPTFGQKLSCKVCYRDQKLKTLLKSSKLFVYLW